MRQYKNATLRVKKPRDISPLKGLSNNTSSNSKRRKEHSKPHSSAKKASPDQKYKLDDESTTVHAKPDATNLNLRKSVEKSKKSS